jgi:tetratricopeptide (TPR) repeat protein
MKIRDVMAARTGHNAFFEELGRLDDSNPEWNSLLAGLAVLRIVDDLVSDEHREASQSTERIQAARKTASAIPAGNPSRAVLLRIVDELEGSTSLTSELTRHLLDYGRALDLQARWNLAADVFETISANRSTSESQLLVESLIALGGAARNIGDWDRSDLSYAEAQYRADVADNLALSLTAQVGVANNHIAHGNLPSAASELDDVLAQTRQHNFQRVEALALHGYAHLLASKRDYQHAIHYAYRSLELTVNQTDRDRILGDIAAAYAGLGRRDTARDGYSIVALTSSHQWVRWQATLNLMELSIEEGSEHVFDRFCSELENQPLEPRLAVFFLMLKGRGLRLFGREGWESALDEARLKAEAYRLHQLAFEVEAERGPERGPVIPKPNFVDPTNGELNQIAEAIRRLREEVASG